MDKIYTERYSHGYDNSVLNTYRNRTAKNSAPYLLPQLRDDMTLLDIGCGPGSISADFADLLQYGDVTAIDISEHSIAQAKNTYTHPNLNFTVANVYHIPFADHHFDVVHAHQVLQHLITPIAALTEMYRVLKPNGLLALRDTTYASMTWQPDIPELTRWMDIYQAIAIRNGGNPNIGEQLSDLCSQAGFDDLSVSTTSWHYQSNDGSAQWWGEAWSKRVLQSSYFSQALEYGLADAEELQLISQAWLQWAKYPPAEFIMTHHQILLRKNKINL